MSQQKIRVEKDSLGKVEVPDEAYYGAQTMRAVYNFPISGITQHESLLEAMVHIKRAAAAVNARLGLLPQDKADAIAKACDEILFGGYRDQFPVDVFQMGAGTSFHMNCNEVIANRAEEILGGRRGEYNLVHPNDHVNLGQSTNDVFPSAMRLSVLFQLHRGFLGELGAFGEALLEKGNEFDGIIKSGRTHLQDAAPVRLGQELRAYARAVQKARAAVESASVELYELGIGGSAVGTGINTRPAFSGMMIDELEKATSLPLRPAVDKREAMQSRRPEAGVSASLRNLALDLGRIANDLRLMASGPRTGLGEIRVPDVAPGSSIMPGKTNPSMLEMLNMVCFQVVGCDAAVAGAVGAGQLELNVMMPIIDYNLHFAIRILTNALRETRLRCIMGIEVDEARCRAYAGESLGMATALAPTLGYEKAAEVARKALEKKRPLIDILREEKLIPEKKLAEIFDLECLTEPCIPGKSIQAKK